MGEAYTQHTSTRTIIVRGRVLTTMYIVLRTNMYTVLMYEVLVHRTNNAMNTVLVASYMYYVRGTSYYVHTYLYEVRGTKVCIHRYLCIVPRTRTSYKYIVLCTRYLYFLCPMHSVRACIARVQKAMEGGGPADTTHPHPVSVYYVHYGVYVGTSMYLYTHAE